MTFFNLSEDKDDKGEKKKKMFQPKAKIWKIQRGILRQEGHS